MCFPCICVLGYLPLLWVVAMPIVGSFCGPDTVLRLSLLMMLYSVAESLVQRFVKFLLPVFTIAFFAVIICLPVSIVPYPLVWLYSQLAWITEPFILLAEAAGVIRIVMKFSRQVSIHIEDNALLAKSLILGVAVVAYLASVFFAVHTYKTGSWAIKGLLLVIIIVSLIHLVLTIRLDSGIISNCAVVTMCMIGALCVGFYEANLVENPLSEPQEWSDESYDAMSMTQILLSTATSSMSHVTKATRFLSKLINPALLSLILIRVVSMQQVVSLVITRIQQYMLDDEDNEVVDESYLDEVVVDDYACLPPLMGDAALPTKISLIFVYTQLVLKTIVLSGGHRPFWVLVPLRFQELLAGSGAGALWTKVGLFRVMQIVVLGFVYPMRMFVEEEEYGS